MIDIILADDHEIMLDGYMSILENQEDMNVVGKAHNGKEVITLLESQNCDVLLLDINMPVMNGLETAEHINAHRPHVNIIVLTMLNDIQNIHKMVDLGVNGYVLKSCGKWVLLDAIHAAAEKRTYFDDYVKGVIDAGFKRSFTIDDAEIILSERETEIIRMVALGLKTNEIAEELFISPHTVQTHRKNINFKLQAHNPADVTKFAISNGILPAT